MSILVFIACLAVIKTNYHPPLYGDSATITVLSIADRTPEGMAAHKRRLASAENIRRASLDPRLARLNRPLRVGDGAEIIGSVPGPTVYVSVRSVDNGTLLIDSVSEVSAVEARSIAAAVAAAYIAGEGATQISPVEESIPTACEFHPSPLGEPGEVVMALVLSFLASGFVLFIPAAWFSKGRLPSTLAVTLAVAVCVLECFFFPMFLGELVDIVVAAVLLAAIGFAAARRPWVMLAVALLIWVSAPVIYDGFNSASV